MKPPAVMVSMPTMLYWPVLRHPQKIEVLQKRCKLCREKSAERSFFFKNLIVFAAIQISQNLLTTSATTFE